MTRLLLLLAGCASQLPADSAADLSDSPPTRAERQPPALTPPMAMATAHTFAQRAWARTDNRGNIALADGSMLYLYGEREDVQALLAAEPASGALRGVALGDDGECLGVLDTVPAELGMFRASAVIQGDWLVVDGQDYPMAPCPGEAPDRDSLDQASARLSLEWLELDDEGRMLDDDIGAVPPPTCTSTCGSNQGYSYAGQTAYSNGSSTGSGNACNNTGTYGYLYQCVEYTERVAGRSDWAGNAYTGYWTNTGLSSSSQGPYYKGLLPLGSGGGMLAPQAGDVVVWSGGTYGHVAVLTSVNSSTVQVVDQNRSCGDQSCNLTYGSSYSLGNGSGTGMCGSEGISGYTVRGYLHRGWDFGGTYNLASSSSTGNSQHNWWLNDASFVGATTSNSVTDITDYITINPGTTDPYMTSPAGLNLPAYSSSATHGYRYVSFYIQSNCSNKSAQLFWKRTTDTGFSSTRSVNATISGSGWQSLTFNPSANAAWSGTIDQIRLDPASTCSSGSTDTISMQSAWIWR